MRITIVILIIIKKKKNLNNLKNEMENTSDKKETKEIKETKIIDDLGTQKKSNYIFNHHQLSFKPKKTNKKSHILKIKSNEKLTILNNKLNTNSTSTNTNDDIKEEKKRVYKISSNVVNEQYYRDKFIEREINTDEENLLTISMQSLNDSNIMEIANRYITEDEGLDKNEVNEILNTKKDKLL